MTRNIFIAIATITFVVLVCINLFSPEQPSDYSYLKTFPESEKLELSENVVVENIDDLYYDYDTDFQGNVTTVYIHDKFSGGYGDGCYQCRYEFHVYIVVYSDSSGRTAASSLSCPIFLAAL